MSLLNLVSGLAAMKAWSRACWYWRHACWQVQGLVWGCGGGGWFWQSFDPRQIMLPVLSGALVQSCLVVMLLPWVLF